MDSINEGKFRDEMQRGAQAERLLSDALFKEAFATVEDKLRSGWLATLDDQERERERLWLMLKLLERVKGHIVAVMQTGQFASKSLSDIEQRKTRLGFRR